MRLHEHQEPSVKAVSLSHPSLTPSFLQNGFEPVGQAEHGAQWQFSMSREWCVVEPGPGDL